MLKKIFLTLGLSLFTISVYTQVKRANLNHENYRYARAIQLYEKALKKKDNPLALQNLANCYRLTKQYSKAEEIYAKVVKLSEVPPITHFYYGHVLLCNNKMEDAKREFFIYSKLEPENKLAKLQLKNMDFLKLLLNQPAIYEIKNLPQVNTEKSEFSPFQYKEGIVFVSDRQADLVNFNKFEWNNQPYLNILYIPVKTENGNTFYGDIEKMPSAFNSYYHDGPIVFCNKEQAAVFTRVLFAYKKEESFVNKPKLYNSEFKNGKWNRPTLISFCKEGNSYAHPAISEDGKTLIFSSDMPGGNGGLDLYVSYKTDTQWSEPKNLGPEINTSDDELFPYLRKDGTLFFSSRGHSGFGGMDIFFANQGKDGKWDDVNNMGAPVNSFTDDFGIAFDSDNKSGYFSSDRSGGKGSDDIYSFRVSKELTPASGRILRSKNIHDPAENLRIFLLSNEGLPVNSKQTDSTGYFRFENLLADRRYMVKLDENDPGFKKDGKYYLSDEKGQFLRGTVIDKNGGLFVFEILPSDTISMKAEVDLDDFSISGTILTDEKPSQPISNIDVKLLDSKGKVVAISKTNELGTFAFLNLKPDENYVLQIDESAPSFSGKKVILTSKVGKEVSRTLIRPNGSFRFEFLKSEENKMRMLMVEDTEINLDLKGILMDGNKRAIPNSRVSLVNEKGEVIQKGMTDEKGRFIFKNLPSDNTYLVSISDSDDPRIANSEKIWLADEKGNLLKEMTRNKDKKFNYKVLPSDLYQMQEIHFEDPWLKVMEMQQKANAKKDSILIIENIYYELDQWEVLSEAKKTLDKIAGIMKKYPKLYIELSSHTDSRATAEYNLALSQKRAKAVVDYIVSLGIPKNRINGKGYGEGKLINKCRDTIECSEEEHARNRRTEFKVLRK